MTHDACHCIDYCEECPKDCYRAQLTEDLSKSRYPYPVAWAMFKNTEFCPKWPDEEEEE